MIFILTMVVVRENEFKKFARLWTARKSRFEHCSEHNISSVLSSFSRRNESTGMPDDDQRTVSDPEGAHRAATIAVMII